VEGGVGQKTSLVAGQLSEPDGPADVVRAAGGVVWRPGPEVLLVHRPKYDDWTLPKGKAKPGESDQDCARREVEEETGLRCRLGRELPRSSYLDGEGRPKVVRYWAMTPEGRPGGPVGDEVDDQRWLTMADAARLLSYDRDREVLAAFLEG
jgi:8-oxo-dGTP diphosphatase